MTSKSFLWCDFFVVDDLRLTSIYFYSSKSYFSILTLNWAFECEMHSFAPDEFWKFSRTRKPFSSCWLLHEKKSCSCTQFFSSKFASSNFRLCNWFHRNLLTVIFDYKKWYNNNNFSFDYLNCFILTLILSVYSLLRVCSRVSLARLAEQFLPRKILHGFLDFPNGALSESSFTWKSFPGLLLCNPTNSISFETNVQFLTICIAASDPLSLFITEFV